MRLLFPLTVARIAHRVSDLKISGAITFRPFTKGFLNGTLQYSL